MAKGWDPKLADVPIDEALTLVVASRTRQGLFAYEVSLRKDAEDALRGACQETLDTLEAGEAVAFGPDVYLEDGEYMTVPLGVVGADHPVLQRLENAGGLDPLSANDIPSLWFYAAVVGDDPDNRQAFVRKADPHIVAKGGRSIMTLGDTLRVMNRPVFVIDSRFDVVVLEGGLAVLNITPFETLFRGADKLAARVEEWVTAITEHIAIAPEGLAILVDVSRKNTRHARRLRSIYDRGHLADVDMETIRDAAEARNLDVDSLFDGDQLAINEETDLTAVLRLLNEDLFEGVLTGQEFAADRKRLLSP